ncbi:MAG: aminodeoxychorismate synthase component I [Spirochaetota bacterium]|nr:aminodeoxychorismate synthase component I [Spirochaetota bacterium]
MDVRNNYFFWLETDKIDDENYRSFYFNNPVKIIKLVNAERLEEFFSELETLTKKYYVVGFFSYELGYLLEEAFSDRVQSSFPYALFCAYEEPAIYDHKEERFISGNFEEPHINPEYEIANLQLSISEKEYIENIRTIKNYIRNGDIYQANYTIRYNFDFTGSPYSLYLDLKKKQRAAYNVFSRFDDYYLLSITPELFFHKLGNKIIVKPMKGTYTRGRNLYEDRVNSQFLRNDKKNMSENIMIVDLLRNDIGKISEHGSVKVNRLYEIEKYNTLFQMTSTIESILEKNISIYELIKSIFPSGSVTGAPKIRSMEIIDELEERDRKIYTGSIGFFEPSGNAMFNVAIRTILIHEDRGEMGIGGGIVYDSTPEDEFMECKLKSQFLLKDPEKDFSIIESILFDKRFRHLDLHLNRMKDSAEYFDYKFNEKEFLLGLNDISETLTDGRYKVRILLEKSGGMQINTSRVDNIERNYKISISEYHTESNNIFFFHKTTNRHIYERELIKARERGCFDVIFLNEKDEITEGSITNIYIKRDGIVFTPPIDCGLLNGTIRQHILKKDRIKEKIITLKELISADAVYISNSIIGFKRAMLCHDHNSRAIRS